MSDKTPDHTTVSDRIRQQSMVRDPLTKVEFETLLTRAAQPRKEPGLEPDSEAERTSAESRPDGCTETHTHQDRSEGT
jgi:hypothetical protein